MGAPTPHPLIKNLGKVGGEWGGERESIFVSKSNIQFVFVSGMIYSEPSL